MSRTPSLPPTADEIAQHGFTTILNVPLVIDAGAAIALARVIRRADPEDFGADPQAWYRALDALSPLLPGTLDDPRPTKAYDRASRG
jgi:hypothetical protein